MSESMYHDRLGSDTRNRSFSLGIVTVGISLSGIAKTFIEGMHAVGLLTLFIGMIFLASGLFKDGFPSSGRAKSATFITLGFLVRHVLALLQ